MAGEGGEVITYSGLRSSLRGFLVLLKLIIIVSKIITYTAIGVLGSVLIKVLRG
jgi:hypothetical protein